MPETETVSPPEKPSETPIDSGLLDKLATLRGYANISSILNNCVIPGSLAADVMVSLEFIRQKHEPLLKECESHPDWKRAIAPPAPPKTAQDQSAIEKAEGKRNRKARKKGH